MYLVLMIFLPPHSSLLDCQYAGGGGGGNLGGGRARVFDLRARLRAKTHVDTATRRRFIPRVVHEFAGALSAEFAVSSPILGQVLLLVNIANVEYSTCGPLNAAVSMVKVTFLDYGAGNIRSLRNALVKVSVLRTSVCLGRDVRSAMCIFLVDASLSHPKRKHTFSLVVMLCAMTSKFDSMNDDFRWAVKLWTSRSLMTSPMHRSSSSQVCVFAPGHARRCRRGGRTSKRLAQCMAEKNTC